MNQETAFVILGEMPAATGVPGVHSSGKRKDVFGAFSYTFYLPAGNKVAFVAVTTCESAECSTHFSALRHDRFGAAK